MAKNYTVSGNPSKGYRAMADGGQRASFTGKTQAQVVKQTRTYMKQNGGGELRIKRTDASTYRSSDTIPPKTDEFPPQG